MANSPLHWVLLGALLLLSLAGITAAADVPVYQKVFLDEFYPGNITHMVVAADGTAYVAGVSPLRFDDTDYYSEDDNPFAYLQGNHIFFGKFAANQFLWIYSIPNVGDDPLMFSLSLTDTGFALIGSFSSTLIVQGANGKPLVLEATNEALSMFVISFNDYGSAIWGKSVGVNWKKSHGPFSISGTKGLDDELILIGNYLSNLEVGGRDQKGVGGSQTFFLVFDSAGNDLSILYTLHRWNEACEVEPCQNGGQCDINRYEDGFYCTCVKGYTGVRCEIPPPESTGPETEHDTGLEYEDYDYEDDLAGEGANEFWGDDDDDLGKRAAPQPDHVNSKERSVFTQTDRYQTVDDELFLVATGYNLSITGEYSIFIHLYQVFDDDIDLVWSHKFPSGKKVVIPSLRVFEDNDGNVRIAIAGTLSAPSSLKSHTFEFNTGEERVIYVAVISLEDGTVEWVNTIHDIGRFHDEPSLNIPIAVHCFHEVPCEIVVAGPSTEKTHIGEVLIDDWPKHQYFLAAFNTEGKALWVKELFPDVEFGEVRALCSSSTKNLWVAGSVYGETTQFDFITGDSVQENSLFVAKVGFIEEKAPVYQEYIAPIIYSEKKRPMIGLMFVLVGLVMIAVAAKVRFGRRFA